LNFLKAFLGDESGQDLIEYTLMVAFVALASAALFLGSGGSVSGVGSTTNSDLSAADPLAS
jgi:Flp pilus assembly pilin Flp